MAMIHLYKALSDLCLYYCFAAPVSYYFGGSGLLPVMLIQSLVCCLSRRAGPKWLRLVLVLPMAAGYILCFSSPADLIAMTPAAIYIILNALGEETLPNLDHQRTLLENSWKYLFPAAIIALLSGGLQTLLPFGVIFLLSSVALVRTLRHNPEAYGSPGLHLVNLVSIGIVPLGAMLIGSQSVVSIGARFLGLVYTKVLLPLLMLVLWLPMTGVQFLIDLLSPLFTPREEEKEQLQELLGDAASPEAFETENYVPGSAIKGLIVTMLVVAAVVVIVLLLKRLDRRKKAAVQATQSPQLRTRVQLGEQQADPDTPPVQSIRRHYRRYLKHFQREGLPRKESSTSEEIRHMAEARKDMQLHAGDIRQLYIRARYAGQATREEAKTMGKLCTQAKKKPDPNK